MKRTEIIKLLILNASVFFFAFLYSRLTPISHRELEVVLPGSLLICNGAFFVARRSHSKSAAPPLLDLNLAIQPDRHREDPNLKSEIPHRLGIFFWMLVASGILLGAGYSAQTGHWIILPIGTLLGIGFGVAVERQRQKK